MNQIGKETPYGTLTKASSRVDALENYLHDKSRDITYITIKKKS